MAKDNKIRLPSSGGGLIRYSEDSSSKIRIKPEIVVGIIIVITILGIILYKGGI